MINVYDFDETIYDGDSSIDFFKYALSINKKCLFIIPKLIIAVILYLLKIKEKEYLKSIFFSFIKYFENLDRVVKDFWKTNDKKIKNFYLKQKNKNDIIISASPEFLLRPVAQKYNFQLIATAVNTSTGKIVGKNCYGEEKVNRLLKTGIKQFDEFYSDSLSDIPLSKLAKQAFIVKKEEIIKWNDYKETRLKKLKKIFFNRDFITFCAIGVINAFNGVWIAYIYSLFITSSIIAYIFGFLTSLCISYLLNSFLNFKEKLSWIKFYKFVINNIPNFLIQVFSVIILIKLLHLPKIVSYSISAIIAVPITFILVKLFVFNKPSK